MGFRWVELLPLLLSSYEMESTKENALAQLQLMAKAADGAQRREVKLRTGKPLRERIIDVLKAAGKPMRIRDVADRSGVPGRLFSSIRRDELRIKAEVKIVPARNSKGKVLTRYVALSSWPIKKRIVPIGDL
jgi:hypothetical protein